MIRQGLLGQAVALSLLSITLNRGIEHPGVMAALVAAIHASAPLRRGNVDGRDKPKAFAKCIGGYNE